jgi:sulfhydrogenase subunit gamma (sulfur reductase)
MTDLTSTARPAVNPYRPTPARITSIIDLTPMEKLFELRLIDDAAREAFDFHAGQFVELSIFGVGEAPISISSAPSKQGFIELCVRDSGDVTGALHAKKCGDIVGLRGPFGRGFPFAEMKGHDILLVAGGLGIAPLKSLINHIHDDRHDFGRSRSCTGPGRRPRSCSAGSSTCGSTATISTSS